MNKTLQKEEAIRVMKELDIYQPYINHFNKYRTVCLFENFGGFYIEDDDPLKDKIAELEKDGSLVYAVTHELTEFGELYSFLIITAYEEEWEYNLTDYENKKLVFAYVWNKTDDDCSEYGDILLQCFGGGIRRCA